MLPNWKKISCVGKLTALNVAVSAFPTSFLTASDTSSKFPQLSDKFSWKDSINAIAEKYLNND